MSDEKREEGKKYLEKYSINAPNSENEKYLNKAVRAFQESINDSKDDENNIKITSRNI